MSKKESPLESAQTIKLRASENYFGKPDFFTHSGEQIEIPVTITKVVGVEQDWHGKNDRPDVVLAFKDQKKRLICNKTNQVQVARLHGDGVVAKVWIGKDIVMFWTETEPGSGRNGRPDKPIRNPSGGDPGGVRIRPKA